LLLTYIVRYCTIILKATWLSFQVEMYLFLQVTSFAYHLQFVCFIRSYLGVNRTLAYLETAAIKTT
jgi:hypothetical protein